MNEHGTRWLRDLTGGRHASPVDQADAILWTEDIRVRAVALCEEHAAWLNSDELLSWQQVASWMSRAWDLLSEVARG